MCVRSAVHGVRPGGSLLLAGALREIHPQADEEKRYSWGPAAECGREPEGVCKFADIEQERVDGCT